MREHGCTFANYCGNYNLNRCQGCSRVNDPVYKLKSEVAKKIARDYTEIVSRYKTTSKVEEVPDMRIKKVYFNNPMTVVLWEDGTKTMVKCQPGDVYSKETGLAVAIAKKALGNKGNFNEVFKKWIPEYGKDETE